MATDFKTKDYEAGLVDETIEKEERDLHVLMRDIPGPEEPHPAYWNNFLIRVHERIEQTESPRKRAWWSPALIWGSLSGAALLLVFAVVGDVGPFGPGNVDDDDLLANLDAQAEQLILVPGPKDDMDIIGEIASEDIGDASYSIVLTEEEIDMINAIEADDDDAILRSLIDEMDADEI